MVKIVAEELFAALVAFCMQQVIHTGELLCVSQEQMLYYI